MNSYGFVTFLCIVLENWTGLCLADEKVCTCKPSLTVIKPVTPKACDLRLDGLEEGVTFYFDDYGYHLCCDKCKEKHRDFIPTVEFNIKDDLRKLKEIFQKCAGYIKPSENLITTTKTVEAPKTFRQNIKEFVHKIMEEMKKPFFIDYVCDCSCHKVAHYYIDN